MPDKRKIAHDDIDEPAPAAPAPAPTIPRAVEQLPSVVGEISALASAGAPFVFFDVVSFCSINEGVAGVTLSASRQIASLPDQGVVSDKVITCHLRASLAAMRALRDTINSIEELLARQQLASAGRTAASSTAH